MRPARQVKKTDQGELIARLRSEIKQLRPQNLPSMHWSFSAKQPIQRAFFISA